MSGSRDARFPIANREDADEWLSYILYYNRKHLLRRSARHFMDGNFASAIFLMCRRLKLGPEPKYLAADMFDRFYEKHVEQVHAAFREAVRTAKNHAQPQAHGLSPRASAGAAVGGCGAPHTEKGDGQPRQSSSSELHWSLVEQGLEKQILLRIASCCQIASKLACTDQAVTVPMVQQLLANLGCSCDADTIVKSEVHVLATLGFDVGGPTMVTYIEVLAGILALENRRPLHVEVLMQTAMLTLDAVFMRIRDVYNMLYEVLMQKCVESWGSHLSTMQFDKLILAAAIVLFATHVTDQGRFLKVATRLSELIGVDQEGLVCFAMTLRALLVGVD